MTTIATQTSWTSKLCFVYLLVSALLQSSKAQTLWRPTRGKSRKMDNSTFFLILESSTTRLDYKTIFTPKLRKASKITNKETNSCTPFWKILKRSILNLWAVTRKPRPLWVKVWQWIDLKKLRLRTNCSVRGSKLLGCNASMRKNKILRKVVTTRFHKLLWLKWKNMTPVPHLSKARLNEAQSQGTHSSKVNPNELQLLTCTELEFLTFFEALTTKKWRKFQMHFPKLMKLYRLLKKKLSSLLKCSLTRYSLRCNLSRNIKASAKWPSRLLFCTHCRCSWTKNVRQGPNLKRRLRPCRKKSKKIS